MRWQGNAHATAEAHGERIYSLAGAHLARPPGPLQLIEDLGGEVGIHYGGAIDRGDALLCRTPEDDWRIEVHAGLELPDASLALAKGLARWYSRAFGVLMLEPPDELASAILLPAPALRLAVEFLGLSTGELAESFVVPLRIAELRLRQCIYRPSRSGTYARISSDDTAFGG